MDSPTDPSWLRRHETLVVAGLATLAVAVAVVLIAVLLTGAPTEQASSPTHTSRQAPPEPAAPAPTRPSTPTADDEPWKAPDIDPGSLPEIDPWAITPRAPRDPSPWMMPSGETVVPTSEDGALLYDAPRGKAFAVLPVEQYKGPSAYPVVERQGNWMRVLLTSRRELPSKAGDDGVNEATGWVYADDVKVGSSPYEIVINIARSNVTLSKDGKVVASTKAGIGTNQTPTPVTRTFVMSVFHDPAVSYSEQMIGLGAHSPTMDSFSGGPAPIAIHAYPTHDGKISNGCVRIPASQLPAFAAVPAGTPVLIVAGEAGEAYP